jgi:hypothetical protein
MFGDEFYEFRVGLALGSLGYHRAHAFLCCT